MRRFGRDVNRVKLRGAPILASHMRVVRSSWISRQDPFPIRVDTSRPQNHAGPPAGALSANYYYLKINRLLFNIEPQNIMK